MTGGGDDSVSSGRGGIGLLARSRSLLFFLPIGLQGAVTLITIPVVVHSAGLASWTAIGIGQSVGAFGFAVQNLGWGITGPAQLGALAPEQQPHLMTVSVVTKLLVLPPLAVSLLVVVTLLHPSDTALAFAGCLGASCTGLAGSWYYVGQNDPVRILLLETLPRVGIMALGLGALLLGAPVIVAPLAQVAGSVLAAGVCWGVAEGGALWSSLRAVTRDELARSGRLQFSGVRIQAAVAAFANAPLPMIARFVPSLTTPFALYDKVQKQALAAAVPLGTIVVAGMVSRMTAHGPVQAARSSIARIGGIAAIVLVGMSFATAILVPLLSLGRFIPSPIESVLVGASVALGLVVNTFPAAVLAPLGLVGRGLLPVLVGGSCSVGAAVLLAYVAGLPGALSGVLLGQLVTIGMQALVARRSMRSPVEGMAA